MIAICSLHKNTNPYVNEWVEHHLNIGFDHIYIVETNDNDTPYIGDFINPQYMDKVTITHISNDDEKQVCQLQTININNFIQNHCEDVEWCAFIDSDEFIHCGDNVHQWLDNAPNDVDCIALNWKLYGDDDVIVGNETIPLQQRIVKCIDEKFYGNENYHCISKKIIRIRKDIIADDMFMFRVGDKYIPMYDYKFESQGNCSMLLPMESINYEYHISHYLTKTLSEFIKYKCSDLWGMQSLKEYFLKFNDWNDEKEDYFSANFKVK